MNLWNGNLRIPLAGMRLEFGISHLGNGHKLDSTSGESIRSSFFACLSNFNSKTSLMDPRFGPAWIAFAHTFAMEGEHDHAVTAYSTCARMFTG